MSSINLKSSSNTSNSALVEQILEQGQKLRNSMVQAILSYDPFNEEIISNKTLRYPKFKTPSEINIPDSGRELPSSSSFLGLQSSERSKTLACDADKLFCYLQGDLLSKEDELIALETLRTISPTEFQKRSKSIRRLCSCEVCSKDITPLSSGKKTDIPPVGLSYLDELKTNREDKSAKWIASTEHLKHVNSLKVIVHSLKFNAPGQRKLFSNCNETKFLSSASKTFFVEYSMPEEFSKHFKSKSKINSGLNTNILIRFCSKKLLDQEAIYFKQTYVHDIYNVSSTNLANLKLKFRISFRTINEKKSFTFGEAVFDFNSLMHNLLYTSNQELSVIDVNSGITLGSLKTSVMFGCDKIHFGNEFIDAVNCNKENATLSSDDSVLKELEEPTKCSSIPIVSTKTLSSATAKPHALAENKKLHPLPTNMTKQFIIPSPTLEEALLFGLIYIPEANYLHSPINSYIVCHSFYNNDTCASRIVYDSNPTFNFHQLVPLLYNEEFLSHMRENFIVIEFWKKCPQSQEQLIGIAKLSLHQFYITYRNPAIVKHLLKNKFPVISVDWWEPITNPYTEEICGQTQALLAIGTEAQIKNIEIDRNLKEPSTAARKPIVQKTLKPTNCSQRFNTNPLPKKTTPTVATGKATSTKKIVESEKPQKRKETLKVSIGIQSDMEPEKEDPQTTFNEQRDILVNLLQQLEARRNVPSVENGTNTEAVSMEVGETQTVDSTNANLRRDTFTVPSNKENEINNAETKQTYDLLASFQKALSGDKSVLNATAAKETKAEPNTFKCHIIIEEALHLPSRKKCKSKRNKGKHVNGEENIYPSAYVTFETVPGTAAKVTKVIARSSNPKWDYRTDVMLPIDLLFNNQKRLIFKVWRKSNGPHLIPNHQTDLVLGFAALDLTVLSAGLPNIQGWFNIVDFSNKCNGQIKISITPLENVQKLAKQKQSYSNSSSNATPSPSAPNTTDEEFLASYSEPGELLGRALKRKFTELEEITQRLKLRLSKVTNDDSDTSNDEFADAFERDINTLCVEDDFDTNNFVTDFQPIQHIPASEGLLQQTQPSCSYTMNSPPPPQNQENNDKSNSEDSATSDETKNKPDITSFSNHLAQGKLRIDNLLEKLTLITSNNERTDMDNSFTNRYVSGCSTTKETSGEESNVKSMVEGIMKELGINDSADENAMNSVLLQQFYNSASSISTPDLNSFRELLSNSESSLLSNEDISRSEPDGQGSGNSEMNNAPP